MLSGCFPCLMGRRDRTARTKYIYCPASQHISPPLSRGRAWDGGTEGQGGGGGEGIMSAGGDDVDNERRDGRGGKDEVARCGVDGCLGSMNVFSWSYQNADTSFHYVVIP